MDIFQFSRSWELHPSQLAANPTSEKTNHRFDPIRVIGIHDLFMKWNALVYGPALVNHPHENVGTILIYWSPFITCKLWRFFKFMGGAFVMIIVMILLHNPMSEIAILHSPTPPVSTMQTKCPTKGFPGTLGHATFTSTALLGGVNLGGFFTTSPGKASLVTW